MELNFDSKLLNLELQGLGLSQKTNISNYFK